MCENLVIFTSEFGYFRQKGQFLFSDWPYCTFGEKFFQFTLLAQKAFPLAGVTTIREFGIFRCNLVIFSTVLIFHFPLKASCTFGEFLLFRVCILEEKNSNGASENKNCPFCRNLPNSTEKLPNYLGRTESALFLTNL